MVGKLGLLVAVTIAVVACNDACSHGQWGITSTAVHFVGPLVIEPNRNEVTIPFLNPAGCEVIGASAFTCDAEANLYFVDKLKVHVNRQLPQKPATLHALVYCGPFYHTTTVSPIWASAIEPVVSPLQGSWVK